jgi:hypothetical protein
MRTPKQPQYIQDRELDEDETGNMSDGARTAKPLIYLACAGGSRFTIYAVVEHFGKVSGIEAQAATGLFAGIGLVLLAHWLFLEIETNRWMAVLKGGLLITGLAISASVLSSGIWEGNISPGGNPTKALIILLVTVLVTASPLPEFLFDLLMKTVTGSIFKRRS